MAPPVFKTGLLSQAAKIANKTLGFSRPRRHLNRPIQANSGHKNVYSAPNRVQHLMHNRRSYFDVIHVPATR